MEISKTLEKLRSDVKTFCVSIGGIVEIDKIGYYPYNHEHSLYVQCRLQSSSAFDEEEDAIANFIERKDDELRDFLRKAEEEGNRLGIGIIFLSDITSPYEKYLDYHIEVKPQKSWKWVSIGSSTPKMVSDVLFVSRNAGIPPDCDCNDTGEACFCGKELNISESLKPALEDIRKKLREILSGKGITNMGEKTYLII
ncbi:hypothetical protein [Candidatus Methanodesulfokora washburnensis]|uniref:Uncharacterized protein n=1 Tax=Candidatus Methanodesulfokora washburnensis TaxID=2478471 RepID=A0A429GF09_9CREN|nr:hypothetical protein [Candidatus Methanodesulfokores washburnensis]RSN72457.1 hypothetical protein D6D85_13685 [Candidatus Methanodesulfokores washburnensis]